MVLFFTLLLHNLLLGLRDNHGASSLVFLTSVYPDNSKSIADAGRMAATHELFRLLHDVSPWHDDGALGLSYSVG